MQNAKCQLSINLNHIKHNYLMLKNRCTNATVSAVVKANAYGLGVTHIAPLLEQIGCQNFFVANTDEALILKPCLSPKALIYILNGVFEDDVQEIINNKFIPVLNHADQITLWQKTTQTSHNPCCIHINTGMNRLGIPEPIFKQLYQTHTLQQLNIKYVLSHLVSAEEHNNTLNKQQQQKFIALTKYFPGMKKSLANSSGIFLGKEFHFDLVRPGAALYGLNPTPYLNQSPILNPLILTAPIIQLQTLNTGESIGYNQTYKATKKIKVATLPLGYADGYARSLSNKGSVFIEEHKAPIIGNISMDLLTIDVTHIPEQYLHLGFPVKVITPSTCLTQLGKLSKTIGYELLIRLGSRFQRKYI